MIPFAKSPNQHSTHGFCSVKRNPYSQFHRVGAALISALIRIPHLPKFSLLSALGVYFICGALSSAQFHHTFEHLSTHNGLSHGSVSAMYKDSRGFMWFGTWNGLNRYDGDAFKVFKPGETANNGPSSNRISKILEDARGNLWVLTADYRAFRLNTLTEALEPIAFGNPQSPINNVHQILTAPNGDVWLLSSQNGLFRAVPRPHNQLIVQAYHTQSSIPLPDNNVLSVVLDSVGHIYVNTNNGPARFFIRNNGLSPSPLPQNVSQWLNSAQISCMWADSLLLCLGTNQGSLLLCDTKLDQWRQIQTNSSAPVTCITANLNGTCYIGTQGDGIFELHRPSNRIVRHLTNADIANVLALYLDSGNRLWVESDVSGISKIDLKTGSVTHFQQPLLVAPDLRKGAQCGIMEDVYGTLWLTLKGGGFGYYEPVADKIQYFYNRPGDPNALFSNFVNVFYADPSGVLWMSTYFKGIEKITFSPKRFSFVQPASSFHFSNANEIRALMDDNRGRLWVATKNQQLFWLDNNFNVIRQMKLPNGKSFGMVYCIMQDKNHNIWLGTKGQGLWRLSPSGPDHFRAELFSHSGNNSYSLSDNNVYAIHQDKNDRIWIGTYGGGINLWQNGKFLHAGNVLKGYPLQKAPKVRHIAEDSRGNLWVACNDGFLLADSITQNPAHINFGFYGNAEGNIRGINGNDIYWIACAGNDVWMASLGGGISRLETSLSRQNNKLLSFKSLTSADGLPADVVFTIAPDPKGNLWLSTENGIACYDVAKKLFRRYGRSDGIENPVFLEGAFAQRLNGSFCFGANKGIYAFRPSQILDNEMKVGLYFTNFRLFGKDVIPAPQSVLTQSISTTTAISLPYNQNVFSIAWAGLNHAMSDKFVYAYKLEGYDNDWQFAGNKRMAAYSKIPPGKYSFSVRFLNPELQALNNPLTLAVTVRPPWWKTGWAFAAYLLVAVLLVELARRTAATISALQHKVSFEKELTETKLRFFTNLSHELRTPLTLIIGPAEELELNEKLSDQGILYTRLIRANAQRLLRTVSQLLDFRKIENNKMELACSQVELVAFCRQVANSFEPLANENQIVFRFICNVSYLNVWIDAEKMESVWFNLLSNAFKFTPKGGSITFRICFLESDNTVSIDVEDNGAGITKEQEANLFQLFASKGKGARQPGTGIGLALARELVQLHNGNITYRPTLGGGSTFSVTLNVVDAPDNGPLQCATAPSLRQASFMPQTAIPILPDAPNCHCVLVVEDNLELRRFMALQLSHEFKVIEADNGKQALQMALELQPDIIVSDVIMPVMDGLQMLDAIKNDFAVSHIPVVLLTSKSSVESKIEGLKYGADAYLTKPFHSGQLQAQLHNLLRQRTLISQHYTQPVTQTPPHAAQLTLRDAHFLDRVQLIVEQHIANPDFKIADIHTEIGMGRSKFYDKLKGLTGLSPIDYVKEARLAKAKHLLESGTCNVSEASYLSGFSDPGYFSKCYKDKFGVPPSSVKR